MEFLKGLTKTEEVTSVNENNNTQQIEIQIEGNIDLFKDEKERIIQGAKQLLAIGKADDMEDAIITAAVMFRGLKFKETKTTDDGKVVVVLRETAQEIVGQAEDINDIDL